MYMKKHATVLVALLLLLGSNAFTANKLTATPSSLDFTGMHGDTTSSMAYSLRWNNGGPGNINIDVTPSAHTQVSADNVTFSSTVISVNVLGDNSARVVYVRVVITSSIDLSEIVTNIASSDPNQTAPVSIIGNVPLPITLASLRLSSAPGSVTLNWSTLSEINNYGFFVQKCDDLKSWTDVANSFLPGYGTTIEQHFYSFTDNAQPLAKYYRLRQVDLDGTNHFSDALSDMATSVDPTTVVKEFALYQSYPNPFNPKTVVSSQLPVGSHVRLIVYDALGREVAVLVDEERPAGSYRDTFDGSGLASGVYYYRLTAGSFTDTKKMVLMK
jgi:hypothetical protein